MNELARVLDACREAREAGRPAVLATVVRVQGSAYRRPGARMVFVSGRDPGLWAASLGVAPAHLERAIEEARQEMGRFAASGVGEEELELARLHLTGSFPIRLETNRAVASALLEGIRLGKGLDYVDTYTERIRAVTCAQVDEAARELFDPRDVVVVTAGSPPAMS